MDGPSAAGRETDGKLKSRLKGKLFGRDKKISTNEEGISDFLHGPTDKFQDGTSNPTPDSLPQLPLLSKLDTAAGRLRAPVDTTTALSQPRRPTTNRKGLAVRFTDGVPEIIGEGGDEAEAPTAQIGLRKRANSHPPGRQPNRERTATDTRKMSAMETGRRQDYPESDPISEEFVPKPFRRVQTGFSDTDSPRNGSPRMNSFPKNEPPPQSVLPTNPQSFAARAETKMRADEGRTLSLATTERVNSMLIDGDVASSLLKLDEVDLNTTRNTFGATSPTLQPDMSLRMPPLITRPPENNIVPQPMADIQRPIVAPSPGTVATPQSAFTPVIAEPLREFSARMAHLFTLFQLSAESVKPIPKCTLEDFICAASWWFLKGRLNLEATIRERPVDIESQQAQYGARQQAYADLAKSLWIIEQITPRCPEMLSSASTEELNPGTTVALEVRKNIMISLQKLTGSMQRNNILPPEPDDAPLVQGLDCAIWTPEDGNKSLATSQKQMAVITIADAFPLSDTPAAFHYGRVFADAFLTEEADEQQYQCPVLVSLLRGRDEMALAMMVVSQDGNIKIRVGDPARGPSWDDVKWRTNSKLLEIRLPRGFMLRIQCKEQDFKILWAINNYETRTYSGMTPHKDEDIIFEAAVKSFQYFDSKTQSQEFPKEPQANCQLRIFENILVEKGTSGVKRMHRGYRVGLITSPKVKNVRGVNHEIPSTSPILFNFLRGEDQSPALLMKLDGGKGAVTMVFTFSETRDRTNMHAKITNAALRGLDAIVSSTPLKSFSMSSLDQETSKFASLEGLESQNIRVINEVPEDEPVANLTYSTHLRTFIEFKQGSITDRINIGPGEFKIRLELADLNELKILRQPQQDITVAVIESQVSKQFPSDMKGILELAATSTTIRTLGFPSLQELHLAQAALTGFKVRFDGIATSFSIARRRMVVPIYKKWDAATTRIQLVVKERVVQLIAFFENFSHGDSVNFTLKSTDIFEGSSKVNKHTLRIVDAKFALPPPGLEGEAKVTAGFVCLDMPDYPAEHDDITIMFETDRDYERFTKALPAPVKAPSRIGSIRK